MVGKDSKRRALALVVPQRRWGRLFLEPARIWWRGGSFFVLGPLRRMLPKSRPSTAARARLLLAARALRDLKYDRAFSHLKETRSSWRRRVRACLHARMQRFQSSGGQPPAAVRLVVPAVRPAKQALLIAWRALEGCAPLALVRSVGEGSFLCRQEGAVAPLFGHASNPLRPRFEHRAMSLYEACRSRQLRGGHWRRECALNSLAGVVPRAACNWQLRGPLSTSTL